MFLLDTNVISELRKAGDGKADIKIVSWLDSVDATKLYISVITLMELELGILLVERRDPDQGARLRIWMDRHVVPEFADRTLSVDTAVALRCAQLHEPNPCAERDGLIAATASVHGMTMVTRNVADFERTGVNIINPWDHPA
jgi:predicted nucleic acid-binding protein